ncbi:MAG: DUF11 domain-containing protein [Clostridia bacterium]|nr:DUF11 domain-containing protein [Clostridia bacterium]
MLFVSPKAIKKVFALCAALLLCMLSAAALAEGAHALPGTVEVTQLCCTSVVDGTETFDNDNAPGHDQSASNGILRTFDTATYHLRAAIQEPENPVQNEVSDRMNIRVEIPCDEGDALFVMEEMLWLENGKSEYDETAKELVLTGSMKVQSSPISVYWQEFAVPVKAYKMKQGETLKPVFFAWVDGQKVPAMLEDFDTTLTISAKERLNVQLSLGTEYQDGTFQFDETESVYGRMVGLAVSVQLASDHDDFKGIQLPEGPISFDVNLKTLRADKNNSGSKPVDVTADYLPRLWDYHQMFYGQDETGKLERQIGKFKLAKKLPFGKWNEKTNASQSVYDSGEAIVSQDGDILHFTFSNYDFAPEIKFPSATLGGTAYDKKIGCFTQAYVQLIAPYKDDDVADMNAELFWSEVELKADTLELNGGPISQEEKDTRDDKVSLSIQRVEGSVHQSLWYLTEDEYKTLETKQGAMYNSAVFSKTYGGSEFVAYPGQDLHLFALSSVSGGLSIGNLHGLDYLIKLPADIQVREDADTCDMNAVLVDYPDDPLKGWRCRTVQPNPAGWTWKAYFAVKQDRKPWTDEEEMDRALSFDLEMYEKREYIPKDAVIVGVFFQGRSTGDSLPADYMCRFDLPVHIDENAQTGYVYPVNQEADLYVKPTGMTHEEGMRFPPKNGVENKYRYVYEKYLEPFKKHTQYDDRLNGQAPFRSWRGEGMYVLHYAYDKTVYDENGQVMAGTPLAHNQYYNNSEEIKENNQRYITYDTGSYFGGVSILINGVEAKLEKSIAQLGADNRSRSVYNLNAGEYRVDYTIQPSFEFVGTFKEKDMKDELVITDTLDAHLTYEKGSARLGGTYDTALETVNGGTAFEPYISTNSKGHTVLTWFIRNAEAGVELPPIHYSCKIKPGTDNATIVSNTATITADTDKRSLAEFNSNLATASFQVVHTTGSMLNKKVDKAYAELKDQIVYTVTFANVGDTAYNNLRLRDILPYDGDGRGTDLRGGTYTVDSISISGGQNASVYTTGSAGVRTQAMNELNLSDSSWTRKTLSGGRVNVGQELGDITALACEVDVPAGETVAVEIAITLNCTKAGAKLVDIADAFTENHQELHTLKVVTEVVSRRLSGLAWFDSNRNGAREPGEQLLKDMKITLMTEDGDAVEDIYGNAVQQVITGNDGFYEFIALPAGSYQVRFDADNSLAAGRPVTLQRVPGVDWTINSDAWDIGGVAVIYVKLPTLEALSLLAQQGLPAEWSEEHLDAGYTTGGVNGVPPTGDATPIVLLAMLWAAAAGMMYLLAVRRREKA